MSFFDRLKGRVGDFIEEVMLPEEILALHERARRAIQSGHYEKALTYLGEAEHRRPGVERTRHMRALCHFYREDYPRAAELFEEALELREEASSHFYLGMTLEKLGSISDAEAHFHRALQIDADPPFAFDLHLGLGRVYLALDRASKASRELRRALKLYPGEREASVALAEALRRRSRFEEAKELVAPLSLETLDSPGLLTLGRIEAALGHPGAAANAFEVILDRDPDYLDALLEGARAYLGLHQMSRANQLLLRALGQVEGKAAAPVYALIGETNEGIENDEKALQSYEAALHRDPDHQDALLGAGRILLRQGKYNEAAPHFETLRKNLTGRDELSRELLGKALLGLGRCRLLDGDFAGARHLFDEARHFFEELPAELLHGLGAVALAAGDPAEALVTLREARHSDTSKELARIIDTDIESALRALRPSFSPPEHFESTADLLSALLDLKKAIMTEPRLESFLAPLHDLITTLDSPLSVAILGEFNAGKSTLVNAILGEEVVPMGVLPTTAHPCIMAYGPRKGARILYNDGRLRDVDFPTARVLMKEEAEEITRLEYTYPHPELRSLNFWDTPGFNALDDRHEELATTALGQAEGIIWMLDANQALKETEFALLDSLEGADTRVLLVLNKIDRFGDEKARKEPIAEILEYLMDHVEGQVLDILSISALEALKAEEKTSDFETLLRILDEQFAQRSWQIKISEVSRNLEKLLAQIEAFREQEVQAFKGLQEESRRLNELIEALEGTGAKTLQGLIATFADRLEYLLFGLDREISDALRRRGRLIRRVILEEEDQGYILELFKERLDHLLEGTQQKMLLPFTVLEADLARALSPLLSQLSVTDARPLRRRMEGFFDESRALKIALEERVFGQWRAQALGQISKGGPGALEEITALGPESSPEGRQEHLRALLPEVENHFCDALLHWQEEYFQTTHRFAERLRRDLASLELEVRYRLDFSTT